MRDDNRILDCGHKPSPHSEHTTGTAHTQDGREICWACADKEQREAMKNASTYGAYLSGDSTHISTWSGGLLATIKACWRVKNNFAGYIYRWQAVDVHGQRWFGSSPGPGMYARTHKNKYQEGTS